MVLTIGAASPLVTLFPHTFSGPSHIVTEVPKSPKVSCPPLEEDITGSPRTPMVMVLLPGPLWAPLPAFSLDYEKACAAACSLLHTGMVAMHKIPGLCPGYAYEDLYSFLLDFGLPLCCVQLLGTTFRRTWQEIFITKDLRFDVSLGLAFRAKLRACTLISWNTRCESPFGKKDRKKLEDH
ncbi:hypothetical protein DSO57_1007962 [Entomophthora muscae]|uniref:Uncharacterized protein n=1 Tax=Entomophthora muscae TaxID=34485 RepID=A0ACC2TI55_9FUNG|nr:hypothetical protein DSO57_1007962 [Entomophthora muscae]